MRARLFRAPAQRGATLLRASAACVICSGLIAAAALFGHTEALATAGPPQPPDTKTTKATQSEKTPRRRVPNHYGKLGLSDKQKEDIYAIQAGYAERLERLTAELEALKEEQDDKIYDVLTPRQKTELAQILAEDRRKREERKAKPE